MSPPAAIGRYRVSAEIGRGAMGVIYRAYDSDIDRDVAIKLVRADLLDGDQRAEFLGRFKREARAAARCTHPNIVAIHDFGLHDGQPFIVMEFVAGESLRDVLARERRLRPEVAMRIIGQVLDALGAAHAAGIVHRDVKPANILLLADWRVKMTDFGIARMSDADLTMDGTLLGTPAAMSPEQCRGEAVDARSDLFSAGVVLFEMLTGAHPFPGRNPSEIMYNVLQASPAEMPTEVPVPVPLRLAVLRALAKRPEERFVSAEVMKAALGEVSGSTDATVSIRPSPAGSAISAEDMEVLIRALARYLGPIARVLARRALPAESAPALREALARQLDDPAERAAFAATTLPSEIRRA